MTHLLLRVYPARWRARYGDEFETLLGERPLGPFDVADVLLGALDAHLHLRGLGAALEDRKGFPMTHRIGGYAAILGSLLWIVGLVASSLDGSDSAWPWLPLGLVGTALLLVAVIGLSAFQARRYPRLTWAACAVTAAGAAVAVVGLFGMVVTGDEPFFGLSGWSLWALGSLAMFGGSGLYAIATWRTQTLSRRAAALLGVASVAIVPAMMGVVGGPEQLAIAFFLIALAAFAGGWTTLGLSALRSQRPASSSVPGVAS
ncbi:MAG TPA: hypothetical protein VEO91_08280 [Candidatus Limnocylindria bacterium]|nr:hypothetical protein [Candidatus Limnocylindria bacterium]